MILMKNVGNLIGETNAPGLKPKIIAIRRSEIAQFPQLSQDKTEFLTPVILEPNAVGYVIDQRIAQDQSGAIKHNVSGDSNSKVYVCMIDFAITGLKKDSRTFANVALTDHFCFIGEDMEGQTVFLGDEMPCTLATGEGGTGDNPGGGFRGNSYSFTTTSTHTPAVYPFDRMLITLPITLVHDASVITATGFTAKWNSINGITDFEVSVATDPDMQTLVSGNEALTVTGANELAITGLTANTTYYFTVKAKKGTNTGYASDVMQVKTASV